MKFISKHECLSMLRKTRIFLPEKFDYSLLIILVTIPVEYLNMDISTITHNYLLNNPNFRPSSESKVTFIFLNQ